MGLQIQFTLGPNSYAATLIVLKMAYTCALSDSSFGELIREQDAVDPNVLIAIETLLQRDGNSIPISLDECGVLNVIAACDIVRKMFACDALDVVMKDLEIDSFKGFERYNIIDYSNTLINDLKNGDLFNEEINELLVKLEENIFPC